MTRDELTDLAMRSMHAFINSDDEHRQEHMEQYKSAMREILEMDLKRHQGEGA
jgi:hypothetical protein